MRAHHYGNCVVANAASAAAHDHETFNPQLTSDANRKAWPAGPSSDDLAALFAPVLVEPGVLQNGAPGTCSIPPTFSNWRGRSDVACCADHRLAAITIVLEYLRTVGDSDSDSDASESAEQRASTNKRDAPTRKTRDRRTKKRRGKGSSPKKAVKSDNQLSTSEAKEAAPVRMGLGRLVHWTPNADALEAVYGSTFAKATAQAPPQAAKEEGENK